MGLNHGKGFMKSPELVECYLGRVLTRSGAFVMGSVAAAIVVVALVVVVVVRDDDDTAASPANDTAGPAMIGNIPQPADPLPPREGPHVEAIVTSHDLATQAGIEILDQGGSAADAAVAVAAVLSVVEPWFSSVLGGGAWALYFDASESTVTSLDGVGPTGSFATAESYEPEAGAGGIHQSIVPGAWDGWMLWLEAYGNLDLGDVLAPAIRIAREGFPVSAQMADWLGRSAINARPDTAEIYAPNGVVLSQGETVFQRDLADTFEALVTAYDEALPSGRDAAIQAARDYYYRGPLAEAIVAFSDANGGYLAIEDFNGFEAAIVEPISIQWDDETTVFQNPPNSQGITMLIALNILKTFDWAGFEDHHNPDALHLQVEALKLAFTDRHFHVGDPARIDVPTARLLSEEHAAAQRERIDMDSALAWPIEDARDLPPLEEEIGDTTTYHITDSEGNAAAVTTSLGAQFLVVGDTGINMNNRMRFLALDPGDPNELTPGYKVRHTSNPYMVFRNGRLFMLGGNTGVDTQAQVQLQQFINVVEFGLGAQEAVSAPRWVDNSFPATTYPYDVLNTLDLQTGFPSATVDALSDLGHEVNEGAGLFGVGAIILVDETGTTAEYGADDGVATSSGAILPITGR